MVRHSALLVPVRIALMMSGIIKPASLVRATYGRHSTDYAALLIGIAMLVPHTPRFVGGRSGFATLAAVANDD
jgi:hypothetical protein